MNIYFDNAATTAVRSEVIDIMTRVMAEDYGNPSSSHTLGRRAKTLLEESRAHIANTLACEPENIIFTSGGTEADNLAIFGTIQNRSLLRKGKHIITASTEHSAVLSPFKKLENDGFDVTYLAPGSSGRITADSFSGALRDDTVFASVMLVNNETGVVNPVNEYASEIKRRKLPTVLHTDAVQGFCKLPFTANSLGADLISVSAHKTHGPKGVGALYVSGKVKLNPLIYGGGQERDIRPGTEALPAIAGFGEAVRLSSSEFKTTIETVRNLHKYAIEKLKSEIPATVIIGDTGTDETLYSPYIICLSLPGYKSEVLMNYLDGESICVSKGSACKKGARSHVLEAMRLPNNVIDGALRLSFSRYNTCEETERFVSVLKKAVDVIVH